MPRIFLHDEAKDDVERIADHIARYSYRAAQMFFPAVWETLVQLSKMPGMGKLREFKNPRLADLRSWRVNGYKKYLLPPDS